MADQRSGWQASITQVHGKGEERSDYVPVSKREDADEAARVFGCQVEEEIDAANGLWMLRISEDVLDTLRTEGGVYNGDSAEEILPDGEEWDGRRWTLDIDAGDTFDTQEDGQ